jgi:hypothetical protein
LVDVIFCLVCFRLEAKNLINQFVRGGTKVISNQ